MTDEAKLYQDANLKIRELRLDHAQVDALIGISKAQAEAGARLVAIELTLSNIREEQRLLRDEQRQASKDTETRIRALEDWRTEQRGAFRLMGVVASVIGAVVAALVNWIISHWPKS